MGWSSKSITYFLKKYPGYLNNPMRANSDFREQIFANDSNNSGETEEVFSEMFSYGEFFEFCKFHEFWWS